MTRASTSLATDENRTFYPHIQERGASSRIYGLGLLKAFLWAFCQCSKPHTQYTNTTRPEKADDTHATISVSHDVL